MTDPHDTNTAREALRAAVNEALAADPSLRNQIVAMFQGDSSVARQWLVYGFGERAAEVANVVAAAPDADASTESNGTEEDSGEALTTTATLIADDIVGPALAELRAMDPTLAKQLGEADLAAVIRELLAEGPDRTAVGTN